MTSLAGVSMNSGILDLSRSDIIKLLSLEECSAAMRAAFVMYDEGQALPPALMHIDADGREFHTKGGGFRMERSYFAHKAKGGCFGNRKTTGSRKLIGLITLFDAENEQPRQARTGARLSRQCQARRRYTCAVGQRRGLRHALDVSLMTKGAEHAELGEVFAGNIVGRANDEEIIIFDATGSATQDMAAALAV